MKRYILIVWMIGIVAAIFFMLPSHSEAQTATPTPCIVANLYSDFTWRWSTDCNIITPTQEVFPTDIPLPTETPDTNCYFTTQDNVNIRNAPSSTALIIYTVSPTKNPTVLGLGKYQGVDRLWLHVNAGSHIGWTAAEFYTPNQFCGSLPVENPFH